MRTKLLRSGLGFFAFAAGISLVNVLVLPYARENYGYGLIGLWLAYAATLALLTLAGRAVSRMRADRAERAARALAPAFTLLLFAVHLLMGYLLEYTPSGDNFMLYKSSQMLATDGNFDNYPYFYLYLSRFSNQWGFTLMLTAFYKLIFALGVTQTFYPLVLVQAVLYVFSTRATLRIARRLSGAKGELMTLLMLACCLPMYVAAAVLYTDTFSVPFIMVALDLALRIRDAQSRGAQLALSAACGAVVLIGCQIKMTVLIALMAAVIVWLLEMKPGRAMLCTALCAAIVGGGTAAVPYLVSQVESGGEVTYQAETKLTDRVMSQELSQKMRQYMRNNVEVTYGAYKFPGLTVCGKSGTAELGEGQISNAMFAGFCTDERYPLAFVVAVENGGYGAATCVPILSDVLA